MKCDNSVSKKREGRWEQREGRLRMAWVEVGGEIWGFAVFSLFLWVWRISKLKQQKQKYVVTNLSLRLVELHVHYRSIQDGWDCSSARRRERAPPCAQVQAAARPESHHGERQFGARASKPAFLVWKDQG